MIRGYKRPDGRMGVRNHVLVLSCVGCANHVARAIAQRVPGAVALENAKGCGQVGKGLAIMRRCLVNLALNPNVFGTLVVGLGCETTKPLELAQRLGEQSAKPVEVITIQGAGGTLAAIEEGVRLASDLAGRAALVRREDMPLSALVLGTNCGGSDATSGLAANPTIGVVADCVTGAGGTVLLGETTELIGTEHILASRAASAEVGQDVLRIVRDLEEQFVRRGIDVRGANPSPGNMKGGLSTLEEKALGGISKGGTSPITQVVAYGQIPSRRGLVIMDTPGYDIESVSGMAAGGAQVLLFSTGRGNPIGNPLMPVIKVTGNASTYRRMVDNMDFDASGAIGGATSVQDEGTRLLELLERVCNGEPTKAERLGQDDFAIYHNDELWCGCL
ncbi:UxaA family hydrolase [Olsenella massiliensis]|uniref:UxaA family hydrolase n=1 Tax=Olsenella massiliensis TaxID=1622075 RepID=UPI00071D5C20|nr:UxaA family hydrolase [Olsenella massiliensis]